MKKIIITFVFLFIVILFSACPIKHVPPTAITCLPGNVIYAEKTYGANPGPEIDFVARSQADLNALGLGTIVNPVDFNAKMIVGVIDTLSDSCQYVNLLNIHTDCSNVFVDIEQKKGACPLQACGEVIWTKCLTAVIDKSDMPVVFNYSQAACP